MGAGEFFPLYLSFKVALTATFLSVLLGVPVAWRMARKKTWLTTIADSLITLPIVLPPSVLGYYFLVIIGRQSFIGKFLEDNLGLTLVFTWQGASLAALVISFPLLVKSVKTAFEAVDPNLEEAAKILGRSDWAIWFTIVLPLAWRGVVSGIVLGFARALGDFGATLMVAGNIPGKTQTMPLAIYDAVLTGDLGKANFLVLITTLTSFAVLIVLSSLDYSAARRKKGA